MKMWFSEGIPTTEKRCLWHISTEVKYVDHLREMWKGKRPSDLLVFIQHKYVFNRSVQVEKHNDNEVKFLCPNTQGIVSSS